MVSPHLKAFYGDEDWLQFSVELRQIRSVICRIHSEWLKCREVIVM